MSYHPEVIHKEAGVDYTFNKKLAKELGYKTFVYEVYHLGELACNNFVFCRSEKDFWSLTEWWSRTKEWKYKTIGRIV